MKINTLLFVYFFTGIFYTQPANANIFTMKNDTTGDNTLTQEEKLNGWQLLFDGKTLNGWRTFKNEKGSWKIENGILCSSSTDSGNADLVTDGMYKNFELIVDWNISPEGNSGILYLVTEDYNSAYLSGPEYQLIDDDNFPEKLEDWQKTAANYAMQSPSIKASNKPGDWNTTRIIVNNNQVEHWLNGKKVIDYTIDSDEWKQQKNAGKWKDAIGYAVSKTGHIALQSSHSKVETSGICFKNIKIKLL